MKTARETLEQIFDFGLVTESEELIKEHAKQQAVIFSFHVKDRDRYSHLSIAELNDMYDEFINQK